MRSFKNTSPETQIILAGILFIVVACGAALYSARTALYGIVDHRAIARLNADMAMAHHLLEDHGGIGVANGHLAIGGKPVAEDSVVDEIGSITGGVASIFLGDIRVATTVRGEDGKRGIGTPLAFEPARYALLVRKEGYRGIAPILGSEFYTAYDPLSDAHGRLIGVLFVGFERAGLVGQIAQALLHVVAVTCGSVLLSGTAFFLVARRMVGRLATREDELKRTSGWLDAALGSMSKGLAVWDGEGRLVLANAHLQSIFGFASGEPRRGIHILDMVRDKAFRGMLGEVTEDEVMEHRRGILERGEAATFGARTGTGRTLQVSYSPLPDKGWLTVYDDVTDRQRAEADLAHMARHDPLTGLANRTLLQERLHDALALGVAGVSVFYLDLDRFKTVNDTLGHTVGDALLVQVAARLLECVRQGDVVARLGGDEFAVMQVPFGTIDATSTVAERMIDKMQLPFSIDGRNVAIGTSIGIAVAPADGSDVESLLKSADMALYKAKEEGRGRYCFYEASLGADALVRHAMEADLRQALLGGGLEMHYQPLVDVASGRPTGFEALMRWRHPRDGLIPPGTFIPVAEETGLIVALGEWGLRQSCSDAAAWPGDLSVAVNLSPLQFKSANLLETVSRTLEETGLAPHRLQLEITESVLMQDMEQARALLLQLRGLGVKIAMDDFGTGYACLSYLRNLPFDKIKIDRSFVTDLGHRRDSDAIVHAVTSLAASLDMSSLAEGVETPEQLAHLRAQGCDEVQGYLFSRPVCNADLPELIERLEFQALLLAA